MRKIILFSFIFFAAALPAQQKGLLAIKFTQDRSDTMAQHLFLEGEQVRVISLHDSLLPETVEGKISAITDSSVVIDSGKTIAISEIGLMGYKTPGKIRLRRAAICVVCCAVMVGSAVVLAREADGKSYGPPTDKEIAGELLFVGGVAGTATFLVLALQRYTEFDYTSTNCRMKVGRGDELQLLKK